MVFNRLTAMSLLSECTGDDIWSLEHCHQRGVPRRWISEISDCFESGFQQDSETIYVKESPVNQYEGIRDVDLACKLGEFLGVDIDQIRSIALTRQHYVSLIREAVEEG